jgi:hypothetical protein
MTRTEALEAATTFVDGIAPRTNSRGYSDGCLKPTERIDAVLLVADWLLAGDDIDIRAGDGTLVRQVEMS